MLFRSMLTVSVTLLLLMLVVMVSSTSLDTTVKHSALLQVEVQNCSPLERNKDAKSAAALAQVECVKSQPNLSELKQVWEKAACSQDEAFRTKWTTAINDITNDKKRTANIKSLDTLLKREKKLGGAKSTTELNSLFTPIHACLSGYESLKKLEQHNTLLRTNPERFVKSVPLWYDSVQNAAFNYSMQQKWSCGDGTNTVDMKSKLYARIQDNNAVTNAYLELKPSGEAGVMEKLAIGTNNGIPATYSPYLTQEVVCAQIDDTSKFAWTDVLSGCHVYILRSKAQPNRKPLFCHTAIDQNADKFSKAGVSRLKDIVTTKFLAKFNQNHQDDPYEIQEALVSEDYTKGRPLTDTAFTVVGLKSGKKNEWKFYLVRSLSVSAKQLRGPIKMVPLKTLTQLRRKFKLAKGDYDCKEVA